MLRTGNFPNFLGKNLVPGKWHSETQTSKISLNQSRFNGTYNVDLSSLWDLLHEILIGFGQDEESSDDSRLMGMKVKHQFGNHFLTIT